MFERPLMARADEDERSVGMFLYEKPEQEMDVVQLAYCRYVRERRGMGASSTVIFAT